MYCKKCGVRITDERTRFCPNCGELIVQEKVQTSAMEKGIWIVITVLVLVGALIFLHKTSNKPIPTTPNAKMPTLNTKSSTDTSTVDTGEAQTPRPPSESALPPVQTPAGVLHQKIAHALKDYRYSLDIKYIARHKAYRIVATISYDNKSRAEYLNAFSKFFAVCYGDQPQPIQHATISLKQADGTELMVMGIGNNIASTIPRMTWHQFSGMGGQLAGWVKSHRTTDISSPENACYFSENKSF